MSERCDYVFEHTGNPCLLPKGHPEGEHKWWANRPVQSSEITLQGWPATHAAQLKGISARLDERNESLTDLRTDLKAVHTKLDALEKRWDESDKLMPAVLKRRLQEFNTLKGQLDAIGAVLAELLAHKPRKTRLRCSKCGLGLKNCKCKVFHSNVRR